MLIIEKPEIITEHKKARIQAQFVCKGEPDFLWYEVDEKYKEYLTDERSDAFVVGLLPLALKEGCDIQVNYALSERLFYTLNKYFIPVIAELFKCNSITIRCSYLKSTQLESANAVGTGLSCGIDSFSTIYDHNENDCPSGYQISHLTFFNVGSHGSHGGENAQSLFQKRYQLVKECATDLGMDLVVINSNLSELLKMGFPELHTLRNMSAILTVQKMFDIYYYSSSIHLKDFRVDENHMGYYDMFNLNMLSTENIDLFSSCSALTRIDKTRMISEYKPAQKHLNVCIRDGINCGKCPKCLRTLLTLELLGNIDDFNAVFKIDEYRKNRDRFIIRILGRHQEDPFMRELFEEMKRTKYKIPIMIKVIGWMYFIHLKSKKDKRIL